MKLFTLLFFLFSISSCATAARATAARQLEPECGEMTTPVAWKYCIHRTERSKDSDVLYLFHGHNHDEKDWNVEEDFIGIQQEWAKSDKPEPVVVTVSFGPIWLLVPKNASPHSGLLDVYAKFIMPYIESRLLKEKVSRRQMMGRSMGSFNAAQLYMRMPEKFDAVVLGCPAVVSITPFAPKEEVDAFIKASGADTEIFYRNIGLSKAFMPDMDSWYESAPLSLASRTMNEKFPPLHISCGDKDHFGFYPGSIELAKLAESKGVAVEWESIPEGRHCVMNPLTLSAFLQKY